MLSGWDMTVQTKTTKVLYPIKVLATKIDAKKRCNIGISQERVDEKLIN